MPATASSLARLDSLIQIASHPGQLILEFAAQPGCVVTQFKARLCIGIRKLVDRHPYKVAHAVVAFRFFTDSGNFLRRKPHFKSFSSLLHIHIINSRGTM